MYMFVRLQVGLTRHVFYRLEEKKEQRLSL